MIAVGIESMNVYGGSAYLDINKLANHLSLDMAGIENMLIKEKSVAMPFEDPVTFAVNAAKPLIDSLDVAERDRIELLITCSESGIDFSKSLSSYVHDLLGLNRNCRFFELKQGSYAATAGFQMATQFILSQVSPGAKALVIATDVSRIMGSAGDSSLDLNSGAGAVAMLVSETPKLFQLDVGASGYYGYEVMDVCRPVPDGITGDSDLMLLSYLDACENSFREYQKRVEGINYKDSFQYLVFHTPFGGMVKGVHKNMMRKFNKSSPQEIENDFNQRVNLGLSYCQQVGDIMGGSVFLALLGIIEKGDFDTPKRIGCFSFGSGSCSEFFSGVVPLQRQAQQSNLNISQQLDNRYQLTLDNYHSLVTNNEQVKFGTKDIELDPELIPGLLRSQSNPMLILKRIRAYHREYEWTT